MGYIDVRYIPSWLSMYLLKTKGPYSKYFKQGIFNLGNFYTFSLYVWKNFTFLISDNTFVFYIFYVTISFFAISRPIFYSFLLLDIMV